MILNVKLAIERAKETVRSSAYSSFFAYTVIVPSPCKVTDIDGIEHSVQVNAESLYEAIARGLRALNRNSWTGEIPQGMNWITVSQLNPTVEHTV